MKNKLLASILTACMLLTMLPTAAFAAEVTEQNPVLPDGVEFKKILSTTMASTMTS